MAKNLTLTGYLEGRGSVKALTRIEAEAFGIPYPLQTGWPKRHGLMEITAAMLLDLASRIGNAKQSTAKKARRGLLQVAGNPPIPPRRPAGLRSPAHQPSIEPVPSEPALLFGGFAVRPARRYRGRNPAI